MTANFTPSLIMALTDYIPVILFLIGSYVLGKFMKRRASLFFFILYVLGMATANFAGLCKATWKLMLATGTNAYAWMDDLQFLFLGIGLTIVFISILSVLQKSKHLKTSVPVLLFTVKGTNLFYYLLTIVVASTIGYLSCLIIYARRIQCRIAVVLYISYGVISIMMGALSGSGGMEIINWIAQSINTVGTGALLIAHIYLNKKDLAFA